MNKVETVQQHNKVTGQQDDKETRCNKVTGLQGLLN